MNTLIISILAFIVAIGLLVVFHEYGHFWAARRLGVKVLRFSVGFGRPLYRWRDKKQTEFVIAAIPLGGYIKMVDEREGPVEDSEKPFAFNRQPVWSRFIIVSAGPLFNFLFAILAYWCMFMLGIVGTIPKIGEVAPNSISAEAGLAAGEEIIYVGKAPTHTWQQVARQLMLHLGDKKPLEIQTKQDDIVNTYSLDLENLKMKGRYPDLLHALGLEPYRLPIPPVIFEVVGGEPAAKAGIQPGDEIKAVNGKPIKEWTEFTDVVAKSINSPITLLVERQGATKEVTFSPRSKESMNGEMVGFAGLVVKMPPLPKELLRKEHLGPLAAFSEALVKTKENIVLTCKMIGKMITGQVGLHTISGPLTIAQGAGATASVGLAYFLGFLALISVSLGVLNLLPIPILDGGHLLYFLIEMIRRRPVSEQAQIIGFKVGMLFLAFLMSIAFYNDLARLL